MYISLSFVIIFTVNSEYPISAIALVRHGDTTYSNKFPDLTPKGIAQVEQTGKDLKNFVNGFDRVILRSSPAVRALGSMHVLLETQGLESNKIKRARSIRPFDIKDFPGFVAYDKAHSEDRYGKMWLTDPYLYLENPLIESRSSLERRVSKSLVEATHYLQYLTQSTLKSHLLLATTHFEIASFILKGLFTQTDSYPIETEEAPQNGEAVILHISDMQELRYEMTARGKSVPVSYNPKTYCFMPIESPVLAV